jgi:hypothetical protein
MGEITLSHVRLKDEEERWVSIGPSDDGLGSYSPKKLYRALKGLMWVLTMMGSLCVSLWKAWS